MNHEFEIVGASLTVGTRVQTPSGKIGEIIEPEHPMPLHHLVRLTNGEKRYLLRRILQPAQENNASA